MNEHLRTLAQRYRATKFLNIVGDQCIPNYPDRNQPTLLVYGEGDIKANMVGAQHFGGMGMTVESECDPRFLVVIFVDFKWILTQPSILIGLRQILMATGAIPMDPMHIVDDRPKKNRSVYSSKATAALSDDDEDEDED